MNRPQSRRTGPPGRGAPGPLESGGAQPGPSLAHPLRDWAELLGGLSLVMASAGTCLVSAAPQGPSQVVGASADGLGQNLAAGQRYQAGLRVDDGHEPKNAAEEYATDAASA